MKALPKQIKSLNAMRFFCCLWVVAIHLTVFKGCFGDNIKYFNTASGFHLDYFFMLSGFGLMLSSIRRIPASSVLIPPPGTYLKFAVSHVKKIYPVYFFTILVVFLMKVAETVLHDDNIITGIFIKSYRFLVNVTLTQSLFGMSSLTGAYNTAAWFLSTLFIIYFFCPALISVLRKSLRSIPAMLCAVIICIILAYVSNHLMNLLGERIGTVFFRNHKIGTMSGNLGFASPFSRIFYVIAGMLVAQIYARLMEKNFCLKKATLWETLTVVLVMSYHFTSSFVSFGIFQRAVGMGLCAFSIFVLSFEGGKVSEAMKNSAMQHLGALSMNFYLLHFFFIMMIGFFSFNYDDPRTAWILLFSVVAATYISGEAAFRFQNRKSREQDVRGSRDS